MDTPPILMTMRYPKSRGIGSESRVPKMPTQKKIKGSLYYSNGKKISRLGFEVIHSFTYNALSG